MRRETRGSETSKYPQEKKSNEIAKVVASEIARGQTVGSPTGFRTASCDLKSLVEQFWESWPKKVKALYTKDGRAQQYPE